MINGLKGIKMPGRISAQRPGKNLLVGSTWTWLPYAMVILPPHVLGDSAQHKETCRSIATWTHGTVNTTSSSLSKQQVPKCCSGLLLFANHAAMRTTSYDHSWPQKSFCCVGAENPKQGDSQVVSHLMVLEGAPSHLPGLARENHIGGSESRFMASLCQSLASFRRL